MAELRYNAAQREEYLTMIGRVGHAWVEIFEGNTDFYSANYWDLLTELWRVHAPVRKTDALRSMKAILSAHTAGKYVEEALKQGFIVEHENPEDARSKLVELSPDMRIRLDNFFDNAVGFVRQTNRKIDVLGPSPEEP